MTSQFNDLTDCPVCFEPFFEPKKLTCDHTFCNSCVQRMIKQSKVKCPKCNTISNAQNIKSDFRLIQFLEALAKQAEVLTRTRGNGNGFAKPQKVQCELCRKEDVSHVCANCQMLFCNECKTIHLRKRRGHRVQSIDEKTNIIKARIDEVSVRLNTKANAFQDAVNRVQLAIKTARDAESTSLKASGEMRQECFRDINKLFDTLDASIVEFTDTSVQGFEKQKRILESDLNKIKEKRATLQRADNSFETEALIEEINAFAETISPTTINIDIPSIEIRWNKGWSLADCVNLQMVGGVVNKEKLKSVDLNATWVKQKLAPIPSDPFSLRAINQQLWACHKAGITVYNGELQVRRSIPERGMGTVCDVAMLRNGDIILATESGLFHLDSTGDQLLNTVDRTPWFSSVQVVGDTVYAANYDKHSQIRIYQFDHIWIQRSTISLPCGSDHFITISVRNNLIKACCGNEGKVCVFSMAGNLLQSHGSEGSGEAGKLDHPYISEEDPNGTVLLTDRRNNRLQTLSAGGKWNIVNFWRPVVYPRSAAVLGDCLYVVSNEYMQYKIYKYSSETN